MERASGEGFRRSAGAFVSNRRRRARGKPGRRRRVFLEMAFGEGFLRSVGVFARIRRRWLPVRRSSGGSLEARARDEGGCRLLDGRPAADEESRRRRDLEGLPDRALVEDQRGEVHGEEFPPRLRDLPAGGRRRAGPGRGRLPGEAAGGGRDHRFAAARFSGPDGADADNPVPVAESAAGLRRVFGGADDPARALTDAETNRTRSPVSGVAGGYGRVGRNGGAGGNGVTGRNGRARGSGGVAAPHSSGGGAGRASSAVHDGSPPGPTWPVRRRATG